MTPKKSTQENKQPKQEPEDVLNIEEGENGRWLQVLRERSAKHSKEENQTPASRRLRKTRGS